MSKTLNIQALSLGCEGTKSMRAAFPFLDSKAQYAGIRRRGAGSSDGSTR